MDQAAGMIQSLRELLPVPGDASPVIRFVSYISWGIGILMFIPVAAFIIFDIIVWLWRTSSTFGSAHEPQPSQQSVQSTSSGAQPDEPAGPVRQRAPGQRDTSDTAASQKT